MWNQWNSSKNCRNDWNLEDHHERNKCRKSTYNTNQVFDMSWWGDHIIELFNTWWKIANQSFGVFVEKSEEENQCMGLISRNHICILLIIDIQQSTNPLGMPSIYWSMHSHNCCPPIHHMIAITSSWLWGYCLESCITFLKCGFCIDHTLMIVFQSLTMQWMVVLPTQVFCCISHKECPSDFSWITQMGSSCVDSLLRPSRPIGMTVWN